MTQFLLSSPAALWSMIPLRTPRIQSFFGGEGLQADAKTVSRQRNPKRVNLCTQTRGESHKAVIVSCTSVCTGIPQSADEKERVSKAEQRVRDEGG